MRLLYNIAAILVVLLIIPVFMIRAIRERGFVERIKQCLGRVPEEALLRVAKKNCIWVHAASVGEVVAASPLIKEFRREFPKSPILLSVVTTSGYEMANRIIKDADSIIYFPLDLPFLASHMVHRILPRVFLPVETELWPNFLRACRAQKIPVMMVNGRISDKSVKQYRHLHSLLDDMIGTVTRFAMQSPIDAEYIIRLGADPNLVVVTGNTKFDQTYTDVSVAEKSRLLREMGLTASDGILLAGSTHRGEEEHVLAAFKAVRAVRPQAKLVIAPRELLRMGEVVTLCTRAGFKVARRTELNAHPATGHDIVVLDTIGELGKVYSVGDVVYVGGALITHGGHNILEPAAHGKAIIVGPHMFNFKETHALFTKRNAVITVPNGEGLKDAVVRLFQDDGTRHCMEAESLAICAENKGAARKSAVLLREMVEQVEENRIARGVIKSTDKVENFQTYFFQLIHSKKAHGIFWQMFVAVLYLFSLVYGGLVNLKLAGYKAGVFKRHKLDCFVISLGNITVGGTGKTPTAQRLATAIRDMGYRVVILNRGYRSKWRGEVGVVSDGKTLHMTAAEAGDEAFMLAKHLPDVPVLIGPERYVTGTYAIEKFGAQVAILDDGYQHWQLERDMDILLVDAVNVFGNGYMLPRGTLREPISHIDRADVCLMTKVDQATDASRSYIRTIVREKNARAIIAESVHRPRSFVDIDVWAENIDGDGIDTAQMRGKRVMAVSAIGNPASFEQTLAGLGAVVIESIRFPDHHDYTVQEMIDAADQAMLLNAEAIIITEKDAVKVPKHARRAMQEKFLYDIPIYVLSVEVVFQDGQAQIVELIQDHLAARFMRDKEAS